ncbi:hypothetical protein U27_01675 [Candidatus Vecturithrix granuli]|uniref:Uncharacterized protein n=1 Tax=Vecturithrix granuli TaxID=1499967 RepID=A0A0S6W8Y6_VECG1|nr:hypothetical protein U27_01675 [Candidatus Vecturithrix granuli]
MAMNGCFYCLCASFSEFPRQSYHYCLWTGFSLAYFFLDVKKCVHYFIRCFTNIGPLNEQVAFIQGG